MADPYRETVVQQAFYREKQRNDTHRLLLAHESYFSKCALTSICTVATWALSFANMMFVARRFFVLSIEAVEITEF